MFGAHIFDSVKMAVYEVFGQPLKCSYKSTLCSKATLVIMLCTALTAFLPLIISYRTSGFWLKTDVYSEQPRVQFMHDYMLLMDTDTASEPIFCSSHFILGGDLLRHCTVRTQEVDRNRDGNADEIDFHVKVPLRMNESVYSVNFLLPLLFGIEEVCELQMQSMAVLQYSAGVPGIGYDGVADLSFVQKGPVDYSNMGCLYTEPLFYDGVSIREIYVNYGQRNYSTTLVNKYDAWITTPPKDENEFELNFKLNIPQNRFIYQPGFWQVMKWAWMQYFSVLIVFVYVFHMIQEFIFTHQLVPTCAFVPWQKVF